MPKLTLFGSVLLASVFISNVGLNANAQKAPSIKSDPFSIEGFSVHSLVNSQASYGRRLGFSYQFNKENRRIFSSPYESYNAVEFTEEELLVKYSSLDFRGLFSWEGKSGEITTDVSIDVNFGKRLENGEIGAYVKGYIGKDTNNFVFGDHNFGHIEFRGYYNPSVSKKVYERFTLEHLDFSNGQFYPYDGWGEVYGNEKLAVFNFSQDSDNTDYPTYVNGVISGYISNDNTLDKDNALVGIFYAKAETDPIVEDEEFSGANGWRDIDYTAQEIREQGHL